MWRCKECDWASTEHLAVCQNCGAWGSLVSDTVAAGPRNAVPPRVRGALVSTKDLAKMDRRSLPLSPAWKGLFGSLPSCFGLMVYGPPGSGKSHWLMLLAAELARFAAVLYVATESGQSNATIQMVQRLEVYSGSFLLGRLLLRADKEVSKASVPAPDVLGEVAKTVRDEVRRQCNRQEKRYEWPEAKRRRRPWRHQSRWRRIGQQGLGPARLLPRFRRLLLPPGGESRT